MCNVGCLYDRSNAESKFRSAGYTCRNGDNVESRLCM